MSLFKTLQLLIAFFCVSTSVWAETPIQLVKVVGGLNKPLAMVQPQGDSRMFIMEHEGLIKILEDGKITQTLLDLTSKVVPFNSDYSETGLLGLALHPNFQKNGKFYVAYSAPLGSDKTIAPPGFSHLNVVEEFVVGKNQKTPVDPNSGKRIHSLAWPHFNHNGHWIGFGPDNKLYVSLGDGGYANDWGIGHNVTEGNGQDLTTNLGKILRIDVDTRSDDKAYGIPSDNPFVGNKNANPEIWAYGVRNPWRCSFDMGGGTGLYCGDVQQNSYEAIKLIEKGQNMGWRKVEGIMHCFDYTKPDNHPASCDKTGITPAIIEYNNCTAQPNGCKGISVAGGYVYRGTHAAWQGKYIFGDWSKSFAEMDGQIFIGSKAANGTWSMEVAKVSNMSGKLPYVLAFAQDSAGEVYALTSVTTGPNGSMDTIYRIAP